MVGVGERARMGGAELLEKCNDRCGLFRLLQVENLRDAGDRAQGWKTRLPCFGRHWRNGTVRLGGFEKMFAPFHVGLAVGGVGEDAVMSAFVVTTDHEIAQAGFFRGVSHTHDVKIFPLGIGNAVVDDRLEDGTLETILPADAAGGVFEVKILEVDVNRPGD